MESFGLKSDLFALDVGFILLDFLTDEASACLWVEHVLGSIYGLEGLRKFIALSDSLNHGLNFARAGWLKCPKTPAAM